MGLNLGRFIRDRKRDIEDVFNPNTQQDQQKRVAAGQPRFYADQQARQRPAPTQYGRPQQFQPPTVGPPQQQRPSPLGNITRPDITAPTDQLRQQAQINPALPKSDVLNKTVDTLENTGKTISNLLPQNQIINRFKAVNQVVQDPSLSPQDRSAQIKELSRPRAILEDTIPGGAMGADMLREVGPRGAARILESASKNKLASTIPNVKGAAQGVRDIQKTGLGKFIFGDKPIETAEQDLRNTTKDIPIARDLAKFGPLATFAGVAMNVPGVGGLDDAGKAAKAISQVDNARDVAKVVAATPDLEKALANVDEVKKAQVLEDLAKETDPNNVKKIVQEAAQDTGKPKVALKQPQGQPNYFKDETEISQTNRILKNEDTVGTGQKIGDYYRTAKGEDWQVVKMTPDEYLRRANRALGNSISEAELGKFKSGDVAKYAEDMKNGDKFPMPWINEVAGSQEGRTRALAAKAAGQDEIPVALAPKLEKLTPEARVNQGVPEVPEQFKVDAGTPNPTAGADSPIVMSGGGQSNIPDAVKPVSETPEGKVRGFTKNMTKENADKGNATAQTVIESMPGYKPIKNRNTLGRAAKAINDNPTQVYADIATKSQLTTADDIAKGNLLLRAAVESGDVEAAIQIGTKLGVDGTKLGQAIQAYSMWKRTTPEGIVRFASKKAAGAGRELDPAITQDLISMAQKIQAMPESLEKAKATRDLLNQAGDVGRTWKDTVQEIISSPRSIMASADLSAPLRQGAVLGSRYPGEFAKNFGESVKYFFSPGAFEKSMYEISQRPTYNLMKSHKLAVDGASGLTGTEEQFMKSILEGKNAKKLGIGHLVAASDRAYTGFLTKFRADVFDSIVINSEKAGVPLDRNALDSLSKFVNSASGRGSGKNLDRYGGLLSQALFSPKLWKSRIDTLNPAYYARLDPAARKIALQSAASFAAITGTILGLSKLAGADVETDPRSADFAKVKVGNSRYDILGGHQQQARFAAQMITGQKINSETGEMQTLGPDRGFGKPSRLDLAYQFVENKENPVVGFATKALRGTDAAGNKINLATEAAKLGIPLTAQGTWETAKDQGSLGKGIAMNVPGTFGVGVQTYGSKKNGNKVAGDSYKDGSGIEGKDIAYNDFKDKAKDGSLVQLDNGKYAVKIGDKVSTADNLKDLYTKINKKELNDSGMAYKVVGETVYRQGADGKVTSTPKIKFDYDMGSATLSKQKRAGDFKGWDKTANAQLDNIAKQLDDPLIDPLEAIKLQNQAESLLEQKDKYASYGGAFKKGKGGSGGGGGRGGSGGGSKSVGDPYKYAVDLNTGGGRKLNTTVSVSSTPKPKVAKKSSSKPRVSLKKSRV